MQRAARRCRQRFFVHRDGAVAHIANEMQEIVVIEDESDIDMNEPRATAREEAKESLVNADDAQEGPSVRQRRDSSVLYDVPDDWGAWDDFETETLGTLGAQQDNEDMLLAMDGRAKGNLVAKGPATSPAVMNPRHLGQSPMRKPDNPVQDLTGADGAVSMSNMKTKLDLESRADCIGRVAEVFPDICREHVSELYDKATLTHQRQSDIIIEQILDQGLPYPSATERAKVLKRKRIVDPDEEAVSLYGVENRTLAQIDCEYRRLA